MLDEKIKKIVYFVRHGQSVGNVSRVFQAPDSPLSEEGKKQAEIIAERVSHLSFETLIASPFTRTKQTAEVIEMMTGKKAEYSELFTERIKPTSLNGKSYDDIGAGLLWRMWDESLSVPGVTVEDGENFDSILLRVDKALEFLKNRMEKSLVVVTHGYFLRTMVARVLSGELLSGELLKNFHKNASIENTGLTVLHYREDLGGNLVWHLLTYNDHAHLG